MCRFLDQVPRDYLCRSGIFRDFGIKSPEGRPLQEWYFGEFWMRCLGVDLCRSGILTIFGSGPQGEDLCRNGSLEIFRASPQGMTAAGVALEEFWIRSPGGDDLYKK